MWISTSANESGGASERETAACVIHINVRYLHIKVISNSVSTRLHLRTNIDIDDRLMRQAMRCSGARTKKAAVEAGLRLLAETHAQGSIRSSGGRCAGRATSKSRAWTGSSLGREHGDRRYDGVDRLPTRRREPGNKLARGESVPPTVRLTDLILCEVLQGFQDSDEFARVRGNLLKFHVFSWRRDRIGHRRSGELPGVAPSWIHSPQDHRLPDRYFLSAG